MELPMIVIVAVVASVIILLVIVTLSFVVRGTWQEALANLWNIPKFIDCLIKKASDPNVVC